MLVGIMSTAEITRQVLKMHSELQLAAFASLTGHWPAVQHSAAANACVHPSAAAFVLWPRVGVQEEGRNALASCGIIHMEEGHVRVPHLKSADSGARYTSTSDEAAQVAAMVDVCFALASSVGLSLRQAIMIVTAQC